jgi:undecaprenyl diphosphate synthase
MYGEILFCRRVQPALPVRIRTTTGDYLKVSKIHQDKLPRHIGIIMDGNGRWAEKKGLPRAAGHIKGADNFGKCLKHLGKSGIKYSTFYALSTENTKRPEKEVNAIIKLFEQYLDNKNYLKESMKIRFIGDLSYFSAELREKMKKAESETEKNTGITCCVAVNYGGRAEIVNAVNTAVRQNALVTEETFSSFLYTAGLPELDLIIRTGGEKRISNFLLWQAAYAEFYFTDTLWCDFGKKEIDAALEYFSGVERRYGQITGSA